MQQYEQGTLVTGFIGGAKALFRNPTPDETTATLEAASHETLQQFPPGQEPQSPTRTRLYSRLTVPGCLCMRRPAPARARTLLLLVLLAVFSVLKAQHDVHWTQGRDGRYYSDIARQVMNGEGLTTRISNYNQGYREWPARTNQAPLWLLTYGLSARQVGLETAARRLPQLLYLVDLVLLYFLANRIWLRLAGRQASGLAGSGVPNLGHAAVALFGANAVFFHFTSLPFTEGLAFGLTFGALLALDRAAERNQPVWGALAGALAALALLTRGQLVAVPIAVLGGLAIAGFRPGGWRIPVAAAAAGALVFVPWIGWLASWVPALSLPIVLGFGQLQEAIGLPPLSFFVESESLGAYLADRWGGVVIAFDPGSELSYFSSFGWPVALAPLAGVAALLLLARRPSRLRGWLAPEKALLWTAVALGAGSLLPVHHAHSVIFEPWLFGYRHGLPFLYLLLPALAFWLSHDRPAVRIGAAGIVALGVLQAGAAVLQQVPGDSEPIVNEAEIRLGRWLDRQEGHPVVVYWDPTRIPLVSEKAFAHWTDCDQPAEATERLIEDAGLQYVLRRRSEQDCSFAQVEPLRNVKTIRAKWIISILATQNVDPRAHP